MNRRTPIPKTVTLHVPFRIVKRGGRREMQMPEGATQSCRTDSTLVKALARAFRWKRMLESGEFSSISELAERERIAFTYMARLMRLSLLSPEFVSAIIDGRQPTGITLADLMSSFPLNWEEQRALWTAEPPKDGSGVQRSSSRNRILENESFREYPPVCPTV